MSRLWLGAVVLVLVAVPARADRIAPISGPAERALRAPVVVVGKVTAIEKDAIDAHGYPGANTKLPFKIAVVKIETGLAGAADLTHIKVGFAPSRRYEVTLTEGQECLFFLAKHHEEAFHVMSYLTPPIDAKAIEFKQYVEEAKKALAAVADPAKALKAEKPEDRAAAATAIVYKLRSLFEETPKASEAVALSADESRPILKALAEGVWKADRRELTLSAYRAFILLGLGEADGWKAPAAEAGKDYVELTRAAYIKWLDGPGKDYRIKKLVPKKEK
jgi:hypothetical protein